MIILIDDCSPDKCGAMCDNLAKKSRKLGLFTIKSIWVYLKQEILELQLQIY